MDGVMKTYFKERVKYLRGSRKMPKQADDILKFDAMQQSIGCCGIFNYTDWSFIKQPPTFPPEELELFQGSPIDTSENQSVPFACCMWHSEVANKTEPAACNHYLATSTDIHLVGCFDFIFYLTVYVWLGLHLLLLAPPTLLLVSGTSLLPPPPSFYAL
nr:unnamed protein product [Spirometra erinaceieuropaei]